MNTPEARIISIDHDIVTVAVAGAVSCARCAAGKGCGAGLLGANAEPRRFSLPMPPGMNLQPGEAVRLQLLPARLLQASALAYGLPLACMLLLPLLAERAFGPLPDAWLAGIALAGLVAAVASGRRWLARSACQRQLTPSIAGRIESA